MKKNIFFLSILMFCLCYASLPSDAKPTSMNEEMNVVAVKPVDLKVLCKMFDEKIAKQPKTTWSEESKMGINAIDVEPTRADREKDDKKHAEWYERVSEDHKHKGNYK